MGRPTNDCDIWPAIRSAWNKGQRARPGGRPAPDALRPRAEIWLSLDLSVLPYDPGRCLYRGLARVAGHPVCLTRRLILGQVPAAVPPRTAGTAKLRRVAVSPGLTEGVRTEGAACRTMAPGGL